MHGPAGRPAEAAPLALRSIKILERECGPVDIDVANVLNALARIQKDLGGLPTAERTTCRALDILERLREMTRTTRTTKRCPSSAFRSSPSACSPICNAARDAIPRPKSSSAMRSSSPKRLSGPDDLQENREVPPVEPLGFVITALKLVEDAEALEQAATPPKPSASAAAPRRLAASTDTVRLRRSRHLLRPRPEHLRTHPRLRTPAHFDLPGRARPGCGP
jgi:hypothetical protein